jgi:hypothetical protein
MQTLGCKAKLPHEAGFNSIWKQEGVCVGFDKLNCRVNDTASNSPFSIADCVSDPVQRWFTFPWLLTSAPKERNTHSCVAILLWSFFWGCANIPRVQLQSQQINWIKNPLTSTRQEGVTLSPPFSWRQLRLKKTHSWKGKQHFCTWFGSLCDVSIYLSTKRGSLFCLLLFLHAQISQTTVLHAALLVSSKSSWWVWVHWLGLRLFGTMVCGRYWLLNHFLNEN